MATSKESGRGLLPLRVIFEHHVWATHELVEYCRRLTPEVLDASEPATYGSIRATLLHLLAEDQRLLQRVTGDSAPTPLSEGGEIDVAELERVWREQGPRWLSVVDGVDALSVTLPATTRWPEVHDAAPLVLLEAVQHGNDHRTQVSTMLSVHGLRPPYLCGWMFWRSTGRVQAP
jgi:uncharacterized damage-inducible protein DinB